MTTARARVEADLALTRVALRDVADKPIQSLSGGMAQRLMIARAVMHRPAVLFLDEPTAGLDPQSRLSLHDLVGELQDAGQTVVLVTHDMDEADRLSDRVAIIDHGHLVALDTPAELKRSLEADTVVTVVAGDAEPSDLAKRLERAVPGVRESQALEGSVHGNRDVFTAVVAAAEREDIVLRDVRVHEPAILRQSRPGHPAQPGLPRRSVLATYAINPKTASSTPLCSTRRKRPRRAWRKLRPALHRQTPRVPARRKGHRYRYYTCWTRQRYGTDACDGERIRADVLEAAIFDADSPCTPTPTSSNEPSPKSTMAPNNDAKPPTPSCSASSSYNATPSSPAFTSEEGYPRPPGERGETPSDGKGFRAMAPTVRSSRLALSWEDEG